MFPLQTDVYIIRTGTHFAIKQESHKLVELWSKPLEQKYKLNIKGRIITSQFGFVLPILLGKYAVEKVPQNQTDESEDMQNKSKTTEHEQCI